MEQKKPSSNCRVHGYTEKVNISKHGDNGKVYYACTLCVHEKYKKHRNKRRQYHKEYYEKKRKHYFATEKYKERRKVYRKKQCELLKDQYVKNCIGTGHGREKSMSQKDIPIELIEVKRLQLQLYRQSRGENNVNPNRR